MILLIANVSFSFFHTFLKASKKFLTKMSNRGVGGATSNRTRLGDPAGVRCLPRATH